MDLIQQPRDPLFGRVVGIEEKNIKSIKSINISITYNMIKYFGFGFLFQRIPFSKISN
jgi:hypothetical protein